MSKQHLIIGTAIASLSVAIAAHSETFTEESGNSVSTITQEPGDNIKRKVIKTPEGQTIIQESGGNKSVVIQRGLPDSSYGKEKSYDEEDLALITPECVERLDEIQKKLEENGWEYDDEIPQETLAEEDECFADTDELAELMRLRRKDLDSSDDANPLRFGNRFAPAQDLKDSMDALREK